MKRLLIANRGEIAVRIARAAHDLGIAVTAVCSDVDRDALHVRLSDRRINLGGNSAADTYLNGKKLILAALQSGAEAIHPGYGFLAENPRFAREVEDAGLIFVGPRPEQIALMADKANAREKAQVAGVPVVPGTGASVSVEEIAKFAEEAGYPLIIKAAGGGSGRGMRVVRTAAELTARLAEAGREAEAGFADSRLYVEKLIENGRHIEVQVFGDGEGNVVHYGERDCSVQRRHQKLVEESPAPLVHREVRDAIRLSAVRLASSVRYRGAGTVEFLLEGGGRTARYYFIEMNTRIQVEHPVTEVVTGHDLVVQQLRLAASGAITLKQSNIAIRGHAIEYRIYAEDPRRDFAPVIGTISYLHQPGGPGIRIDSYVEAGSQVSPYYDSLLAKLVVSGSSREEVLARSRRALSEFLVEGVDTTLGFHRWLISQPDFINGRIDVQWIGREYHGEVADGAIVGPLELPRLRNTSAKGNADQ